MWWSVFVLPLANNWLPLLLFCFLYKVDWFSVNTEKNIQTKLKPNLNQNEFPNNNNKQNEIFPFENSSISQYLSIFLNFRIKNCFSYLLMLSTISIIVENFINKTKNYQFNSCLRIFILFKFLGFLPFFNISFFPYIHFVCSLHMIWFDFIKSNQSW